MHVLLVLSCASAVAVVELGFGDLPVNAAAMTVYSVGVVE